MKKILAIAALTIVIATSASAWAATCRIAAVGDLMVHEQQLTRAKTREGRYDFAPCFEHIAPIVSAADIAVGNFETTLTSRDGAYTGYPCFKSPYAFADALKKAGFDLLQTANNHCMDGGFAGLQETIFALRGFGFKTAGTYMSEGDRKNILTADVNGIKTAFVSWTYGTNGIAVPEGKKWAVAALDAGSIAADITRAKALRPDFIIAMPHLGTEYRETPPDSVRKIVDAIAAAGADIIIAGHPHVVQHFEFRRIQNADGSGREVFIAWSMGNCISFQRTRPRDVGVILELMLEKTGARRSVSAAVIPTWVQIRQSSGSRIVRVLPIGAALAEPRKFAMRQSDVQRLLSARRDFIKNAIGNAAAAQDEKFRYGIGK